MSGASTPNLLIVRTRACELQAVPLPNIRAMRPVTVLGQRKRGDHTEGFAHCWCCTVTGTVRRANGGQVCGTLLLDNGWRKAAQGGVPDA